MNDETERSVASAGSVVGEPMAWAVLDSRGSVAVVYACREAAEAYCESTFNRCVPLYRQPQGAITDEEKRAIGWAAEMMEVGSLPNSLNRDDARILRALLERVK
jgi:hypothetical protein